MEKVFSYLKINFTQIQKEETQPMVQNNSVNKCIFYFLGARIWVPMPVYRYENLSGYVSGTVSGPSFVYSFSFFRN